MKYFLLLSALTHATCQAMQNHDQASLRHNAKDYAAMAGACAVGSLTSLLITLPEYLCDPAFTKCHPEDLSLWGLVTAGYAAGAAYNAWESYKLYQELGNNSRK